MDSYDLLMNHCKKLKIPVIKTSALLSREGMVYRSQSGRAVIFISPFIGRNRASYVGWHELAHYFSPIYDDNPDKSEKAADNSMGIN